MRKEKMWIAAGVFCAALGAGCLLRSEYEKEQLSVEKTVITSDKIWKDCTIVFLSDLHSHCFGQKNYKLLAAIDQINPDVILVGGDMMVAKGKVDTSVSLMLMKRLASRYPVFYGNGNHEMRMDQERHIYGDGWDRFRDKLKDLGVIVLSDRTEVYRRDIAVSGIDMDSDCYSKFSPVKMTRKELEEKVGTADAKRFQILLCHSPLYFQACETWGADLTLSGHFHGGTIRLPLVGGIMTPQFQFFNPYCAGTFTKDNRHMIVSRGLGTHSVNIRINNKPQIVVAKLKAKR